MASLPTPNAARVGSFDPKTERLPEGAVLMTEVEAINIIRNRIATWKPQEQVWAMQLAPYLHAFGTFALGCNLYFAYKRFFAIREATSLLLGAYGTCAMPPIMMSHFAARQQEKLIMEHGARSPQSKSCGICFQLRTTLANATMSVGLPHFVAGTFFIATAALTRTYPVPNLLDFRRVGGLVRKLYASNIRGALFFAALNIGGALYLVDEQQQQLGFVLSRLQSGDHSRKPVGGSSASEQPSPS